MTGHLLFVNVNSTFAGLYAYQKWAKMQLYTNVYKVTGNGNRRSTRRTTRAGTQSCCGKTQPPPAERTNQLYGIVLYNVIPSDPDSRARASHSYRTHLHFKLTFIGDTLGNNFDPVPDFSVCQALQYQASTTRAVTGSGTSITNITEPAQVLTVTSAHTERIHTTAASQAVDSLRSDAVRRWQAGQHAWVWTHWRNVLTLTSY